MSTYAEIYDDVSGLLYIALTDLTIYYNILYIVKNFRYSKYGIDQYYLSRETMISHLNLVNSAMSKFDEHCRIS